MEGQTIIMKADEGGRVPKNLPVMSFDPVERMVQNIQRWDPSFTVDTLSSIFNYPIASDYELMRIYLYGGAKPFVDFLVYIDLGVGWTYRAVGFKDEEVGREAVKKAEEFTKKVKLAKTMNRFASLYETLGRSCIIKTKTLAGGFYSDPKQSITGIDCINPLTLDNESIKEVNKDRSGNKMYKQVDEDGTTQEFAQDRVYYVTQNNLAGERSDLGVSKIQGCVASFRSLAKFPEYQSKLAKLYSEVVQTIIVDTEKMEGPLKEKMMESNEEAQKFLDETAEYYRKLARQGSIAAVFDWFEIVNTTFAGQEVNLDVVKAEVLGDIARVMGVPLALIDAASAEKLNRSVLEAIRDTIIAMQENGTRKLVYQDIIEEVVNEHLESEGVTQGKVECLFNPFLSDNLLEAAQIISLIWQTQAISRPEVRERVGEPPEVNLGGKEWEDRVDIDPMPEEAKPTPIVAPTGPQDNTGPNPDGNNNAVKGGGVKAPPATDKVNQVRKTLLERYPELIRVVKDG